MLLLLFSRNNGAVVTPAASVAGRPRKRKYYIELPDGRHLHGDYRELADVLVSLREETSDAAPIKQDAEIKKEPPRRKAKKPPKIAATAPEPVTIDVVDWLAEIGRARKLAEIARLAMLDEDDELFSMMMAA